METGTVVSWAKAEGEQIEDGDLLAEIETDKATMAMDASDEGFLAKILSPAGTKDIPVGTPLCVVVEDQSDVAAFKNFSIANVPADSAAPIAPKSAGDATPPAPPPPPAAAPSPAATLPPASPASPATAASSPGTRVFSSPLARSLAKELGIDLSAAQGGAGSGPNGRIRAADLKQIAAASPSFAAAASPAVGVPGVAPPSSAAFEDLEITQMRRVIASRLTASKQTVPHYQLSVDVCLDEVIKLRALMNNATHKQASEKSGGDEQPIKISVNDFIVKAMAAANCKVPECNSAWHDTFIRRHLDVDVSVAVASPAGLITPIVFAANKKTLSEINLEVKRLADKARSNKLQPHEFQGGTITLSNLGMFGVDSFNAIINPPQACILAVGRAQQRVVMREAGSEGEEENDKKFVTENFMSATLSCDHRVVDGAVGAKWLAEFKRFLETPSLMLF